MSSTICRRDRRMITIVMIVVTLRFRRFTNRMAIGIVIMVMIVTVCVDWIIRMLL